MSSINSKTQAAPIFTHEGGKAVRIDPVQQLVRSVMACMLWEDNFYESGQSIADRIKSLVHAVPLERAAAVAIEARNNMKLRHVPLLVVREMARHPDIKRTPRIVSDTLCEVIQRPDELAEFMAIYWKDDPKQPLSAQVKLGLSRAFAKFNEYGLAKYNREKDVRLRDVLFLCHAKPADVPKEATKWNKAARAAYNAASGFDRAFTDGELLYGKLVNDQLAAPDTWEVELSSGKDKGETFGRLMAENKLGDLAFLRNLRNMRDAGVAMQTIEAYGDGRRWGRVLPFRFIAAARVVPDYEPMLERWMLLCLASSAKLTGRTALLIDVSGSMNDRLSAKSDLNRLDAAKALAILLREICEYVDVMVFNTQTGLVPARRGFALGDSIGRPNGGTDVRQAVLSAQGHATYDRIMVLTDEQSMTVLPLPNARGYVINVAANQNGIGYREWLHIDGFSESVVDYITKYEADAV